MIHSLEIERGVLNRVIWSGEDCRSLIESLEPDDFYGEVNRAVFTAVKSAHREDEPVDPVSIAHRLDGKINDAGGAINTLYREAFISDPDWAVAQLKQMHIQRDIAALMDRSSRALNERPSAAGIDVEAQSIADAIIAIKERQSVTKWRTAKEAALDVYQGLTDESRKRGGVKTGYSKLDHNIGQIRGGKLVTIAGRPGQGKTSFALDLIKHWCHSGIPVGFLSLEMQIDEIYYALVAKFGKVAKDAFRNPDEINEWQWQKINEALESISSWPFYIYDKGSKHYEYIKTIIRRMVSSGAKVIVIDQLSRMELKAENTRESYSMMVDGLKNLAGELSVPIFLLCQVSRKSEEESDKFPKVWQLKNTGTIEETSDIILMVHLPYEYSKDEEDRCRANIIIGKNRNGSTGIYRMAWNELRCAFED